MTAPIVVSNGIVGGQISRVLLSKRKQIKGQHWTVTTARLTNHYACASSSQNDGVGMFKVAFSLYPKRQRGNWVTRKGNAIRNSETLRIL